MHLFHSVTIHAPRRAPFACRFSFLFPFLFIVSLSSCWFLSRFFLSPFVTCGLDGYQVMRPPVCFGQTGASAPWVCALFAGSMACLCCAELVPGECCQFKCVFLVEFILRNLHLHLHSHPPFRSGVSLSCMSAVSSFPFHRAARPLSPLIGLTSQKQWFRHFACRLSSGIAMEPPGLIGPIRPLSDKVVYLDR